MISHIMVPYDQSDAAKRALDVAVDLAKKYSSKISIVACVVPQVPADPTLAASYAETLQLVRKNASNAVASLELELSQKKIPVMSAVMEGISVTEGLLSYAASHRVDLIVMGSRGLGGFKKLLLGSVASSVSQHSKCPVLIVK